MKNVYIKVKRSKVNQIYSLTEGFLFFLFCYYIENE